MRIVSYRLTDYTSNLRRPSVIDCSAHSEPSVNRRRRSPRTRFIRGDFTDHVSARRCWPTHANIAPRLTANQLAGEVPSNEGAPSHRRHLAARNLTIRSTHPLTNTTNRALTERSQLPIRRCLHGSQRQSRLSTPNQRKARIRFT